MRWVRTGASGAIRCLLIAAPGLLACGVPFASAAAAGAGHGRSPPAIAPPPVPLRAPAGAAETIAVAAPPAPLARPGTEAGGAPEAATGAARSAPPRAAPPVRTSRLALTGLMDRGVVGRDNGAVGHVIDVLVDPDGRPEALLVETGGFLGLGDRKIAVGWANTSFPESKPGGPVKLNMTPDEVRAAPAWTGSGPVTIAVGPAPPPPPGPPPVVAAPPALARPAPAANEAVPVAPAPVPLAAPRRTRSR